MKRMITLAFVLPGILAIIGSLMAAEMDRNANLQEGIYACFDTNKGKFLVLLHAEQMPKTVENFVSLVEGKMTFTDPRSGQKTKRRFYDNTVFHMVDAGRYVQGGSPLGRGSSEITFPNPDEKDAGAKTQPGSLIMFQREKETGSSLFIITADKLDWLDGQFPIFGKVVHGLKIIEKISREESDKTGAPLKPANIGRIEIIRVTPANPFNVIAALNYSTLPKPEEAPVVVVEIEEPPEPEPTPIAKPSPEQIAEIQKRLSPRVINRKNWMGTEKETLLSPRERRVYREALWKEKIEDLRKQKEEERNQAQEQSGQTNPEQAPE